MTKFLYIADTHLGADSIGYQQQKKYPEQLPAIIQALGEYISVNDVDFVLHGGDMIESTTDENIQAAVKIFDLPVPVYLCFGNHDLMEPNAVDRWLKLAPRFFINGSPNYTIETKDCIIHVLPNHWGDAPFFWDNEQRCSFSSEQIELLSNGLSMKTDLPHIVLTHSPVFGLPVEQTGFSEPHHSPIPSFTEEMISIVKKHKNIKCVLSAHNHMNMRVDFGGVEFVTVSSMIEVPFEFKVFEVTPERINMKTVGLNSLFDAEYDISKSFVQGRDVDRSLSKKII
jgi:predicted phosphodiesterase